MINPALADLKPGDRVQVFDVNGSRNGQPKGGWDGIVTKVGRKLITVTYNGSHRPKAFRLDDGRANDNYGHQHIETVEQATENLRRADILTKLRVGGLELTHRVKIDTDTLAAVLAVLNQSDEEN